MSTPQLSALGFRQLEDLFALLGSHFDERQRVRILGISGDRVTGATVTVRSLNARACLFVRLHVQTDGYGSDVVTNGAFAADTDWTKGTGWTIAAGAATHAAGAESALEQAIAAVGAGETWQLTFTVSGRTAGSVTPYVGDEAGTARSTDDTFEEDIEAGAGANVGFTATSDFDGSIDDVTLVPYEGGATYSPLDFLSSAQVDCREDRQQDHTVTRDGVKHYYVWLIPEFGDADGTFTKFDGEDGDDHMAFADVGV